MYSIITKAKYRDELVYFLKKNNIEASVHFDPPLHKQGYLKKYTLYLKNTEKLSKTIVTLPIYPGLDKSKQKYMFKKIDQWYKNKKNDYSSNNRWFRIHWINLAKQLLKRKVVKKCILLMYLPDM